MHGRQKAGTRRRRCLGEGGGSAGKGARGGRGRGRVSRRQAGGESSERRRRRGKGCGDEAGEAGLHAIFALAELAEPVSLFEQPPSYAPLSGSTPTSICQWYSQRAVSGALIVMLLVHALGVNRSNRAPGRLGRPWVVCEDRVEEALM